MSRADQRRAQRRAGRTGPGRRRHPAWIVVGSVVAALLLVAVVDQVRNPNSHHPTPRVADMAPDVLPDTRYDAIPRVAEVYRMAAQAPTVLDGVYCYCRCSQHSGHYSLLDCFASDHAAGCDICLSEAVIAFDLTAQGADLDAIRDRVDGTYGT